MMSTEEGAVKTFQAGHGWFRNCRKHCNYHNLKMTSEVAPDDVLPKTFP